ncbi:uncharacterized protein LOC142321651 [Lycorma delicatula]|uniref:uncharacterized protein LOC142321651 n=1 Tax=Lycorma delicatula TaxID=130591 RepID=UPI003F51558F
MLLSEFLYCTSSVLLTRGKALPKCIIKMKTTPAVWNFFTFSNCILSLMINVEADQSTCNNNNKKINSSEMQFTTSECGTFGNENYSMYFKKCNSFVSPFHDIPLYNDENEKLFNMIVEIPRGTNAKMEISKSVILNPIKHDVINGKIRFIEVPYIHNYGAFPQTWEDPYHKDQHTNCIGDNDPIDVVEIGCKTARQGEIVTVKVLGIFALIDQGETDWKVLALNVNDPNANQLNDVCDVQKRFPNLLEELKEWFKTYKMPKITTIGLNEEIKDRQFAHSIINETNCHWKRMILSNCVTTTICRENLSVTGSPFKKPIEDILCNIPEMCRS